MDQDKLIQQLLATFIDELEEYVAQWNDNLLLLEEEKEPDKRRAGLHSLFRIAHSVKGAARSVDQKFLEFACHQLENLMSLLRDQARPLSNEEFQVLYEAGDALEDTQNRLRYKQQVEGGPFSDLLDQLLTLSQAAKPPSTAANEAPQPQPYPKEAPSEAAQILLDELDAIRDDEPIGDASELDSSTVRLSGSKVNTLLGESGELLTAANRMAKMASELLEPLQLLLGEQHIASKTGGNGQFAGSGNQRFKELLQELEQRAARLLWGSRSLVHAAKVVDESARSMRMAPFREACRGLERNVRDLSKALTKKVELVLDAEVELDRVILSSLKDPLRHLVRNAVDHAIELPQERLAAGKSETGRVIVSAELRGSQVCITVADDGRGLDRKAIRHKLEQLGKEIPEDDAALLKTIFRPGFSTARMITDISGRGVGLDVVRTEVESLHGIVDVHSTLGAGTAFKMIVPLTLTTIRALIVSVNRQFFALVSTNVVRLLRVRAEDVTTVEGRGFILSQNMQIPIVTMAESLGIPTDEDFASEYVQAVVLTGGDQQMAFIVDEFLAEQEVVVKNLGARLRRVRNIAGTTILPDGSIGLILNAADLIRHANQQQTRSVAERLGEQRDQAKRRILLADDSITTRTLEQNILEAAGFEVLTASDGQQGWEILQRETVDLVVSDVEMPRMTGLELTQNIRRSSRHASLPVILITTLDSPDDRMRGVEAGANAYLVKAAFDQTRLLETIGRLL